MSTFSKLNIPELQIIGAGLGWNAAVFCTGNIKRIGHLVNSLYIPI
jgi:hypothetical protein